MQRSIVRCFSLHLIDIYFLRDSISVCIQVVSYLMFVKIVLAFSLAMNVIYLLVGWLKTLRLLFGGAKNMRGRVIFFQVDTGDIRQSKLCSVFSNHF